MVGSLLFSGDASFLLRNFWINAPSQLLEDLPHVLDQPLVLMGGIAAYFWTL